MLKLSRLTRLAVLLAVVSSIVGLAAPSLVQAAACSGTTTYGTVTMSVTIPVAGEYIVWARIQTPSPSASGIQIDVNGYSCFAVGNASVPVNTWTWLNYQGATTSNVMKYTFTSEGPKTIKVIGMQSDIKIDKLVFIGTSEQCATNGSAPTGDGTNCESVAATTPSSQPIDTTPVAQTTIPPIVSAQPENVEKVEYYVNGQLVQTSTKATGFDTTLVENGNYELLTKVAYKDGTTAEAKQEIVVSNPPQTLGTARRWMKRNKQTVGIGVATVSFGALSSAGYFGFQMYRHKKLFLMHHGLTQ